MTLLRTFLMSIAVAAFGVLIYAFATREEPSVVSASAALGGKPLLDGVFVRDQIKLDTVGALNGEGYRTIVNLRPNGEEPGQPTSAAVADAAAKAGLSYVYIPTPHGDIPDSVVEEMARTLAASGRPAVLYCRSGKRAARVWALAEASRADGPTAAEIVSAVKAAGQTVDDLLPRIEKRISSRTHAPATNG